jgi:predicted O-linked N-acetylglucosamine transferase (SPINDLY family)
MGRFDEAAASFQGALRREPRDLQALVDCGGALSMAGRSAEALDCFDRALALRPRDPQLLIARGGLLNALGRWQEALAALDEAIRLGAAGPDLLVSRGQALMRLGRVDEGLQCAEQALAADPASAAAHLVRGAALRSLGHPLEALAALDQAARLQPNWPEAWNDRGVLLHWDLHRSDEALASLDRCLALDPRHLGALINKGALLWRLDRVDEAQACLDRALALNPDAAGALYNRGSMVWSRRRLYAPALADLERLMRIEPDHRFLRGEIAHMKAYVCDWDGFDADLAAIDAGVRAGRPVIVPFAYQPLSASPADLQACARIYARQHPARPGPAHAGSRSPGRIRVGYVCGEFREQATAHLAAGLFERHDRDRFEVIAFDNGQSDGSSMRARLEAAFDQLVPIRDLDDDAAATRVCDLGVDVLVNLNGYFGQHRMDLFGRRPAPVQVNFLGFPGTLGAPYLDYILADSTVIPEAEFGFYDEAVVWLPDSYQVNDDRRVLPPPLTDRAGQGLPEGGFVFCHFNSSYKLTPAVFQSWMRILRAAEGSVLWLLEGPAPMADNLRRAAALQGVDPARLVFAPMADHQAHLARLPLGDLFLDSLPYNAHTTASDALWMGLPVLTIEGTAFAGRVGASLLKAAGLPELVTPSRDSYEAEAVRLSREPERLAALRQRLAGARTAAPLFDTTRFTRGVEAAYETMLARWRAGEPPAPFAVEPPR